MGYLLTVKGLAISTEMGPRRCPFCYSALVHSSRRSRISERLVFPLLLIRPFRCGACGERHHAFYFRQFDGPEAAKAIVEQMPRDVMFQQPRPKAVKRFVPLPPRPGKLEIPKIAPASVTASADVQNLRKNVAVLS